MAPKHAPAELTPLKAPMRLAVRPYPGVPAGARLSDLYHEGCPIVEPRIARPYEHAVEPRATYMTT